MRRKITSSAPEKRLALAMLAAAKRRMSILGKELDAGAGYRMRSILGVV